MAYQTGTIRKIWLVICWWQRQDYKALRRNSLFQLEEGRGHWTSKYLYHFPGPRLLSFSITTHSSDFPWFLPPTKRTPDRRLPASLFPRFPVKSRPGLLAPESRFPRPRYRWRYRQNVHKSCVLVKFTHHISPWLLMSCNTFSASLNSG